MAVSRYNNTSWFIFALSLPRNSAPREMSPCPPNSDMGQVLTEFGSNDTFQSGVYQPLDR